MVTPSRSETLPRVAITCGEVSGIGPEIALHCAHLDEVRDLCRPVLIGPAGVLARVARTLSLELPPLADPTIFPGWRRPDPPFASSAALSGSSGSDSPESTGGSRPTEVTGPSTLTGPILADIGNLDPQEVTPGVFSAATGAASYAAVDFAIGAALRGEIDAIVTGPIQKEAWHLAGIGYPGHTEMLADKTGVSDVRMMLTSETISCALVTIHLPLADVPGALTVEGVHRTIRLAADAIERRIRKPVRVTVCGLNPHAGEHGLFSHGEEESIIEPAIRLARDDGMQVVGPLPPDTAFTPRLRQETDVYVCMYHDQGLIPLKALSFEDAVNVTLGLPIVRTSVDHGTALDLAWQGRADHRSMVAAIRLAAEMSR